MFNPLVPFRQVTVQRTRRGLTPCLTRPGKSKGDAGTGLPGPGAVYTRRTLNFRAAAGIGGSVRAAIEIMDLNPLPKQATLETTRIVKEKVVIDGQACVLVPSRA